MDAFKLLTVKTAVTPPEEKSIKLVGPVFPSFEWQK